jgi:hypothetical protein
MRKELVCGIIVLVLGMSIVPLAGSNSIEKGQSMMAKGCSDDIIITGTMGEHFWYISPVIITFEGEVPYFVKIDQGDWFEYTGPIVVDTDGVHIVWWYYIDPWGNPSPISDALFKIDMTPPTVTIIIHRIGLFKIGVTVYPSDNTSGVGCIEFYLDDALVGNLTTEPYEFVIEIGSGKHTVAVIAYDMAGNSAESSISTPYAKSHRSDIVQNNIQLIHNLLYKLILRIGTLNKAFSII